VPFDPVDDKALPEACTGLYAGGGFPEVFAEPLAANRPLFEDVRRRVAGGLVTWAECGGLLWLSRSPDGYPLAGAVDAEARMTDRLALGYRRARVCADNPVAPVGTELRGHEFHYSTTAPTGHALELGSRFDSKRKRIRLANHLGQLPPPPPPPRSRAGCVTERFVAAVC